ncbi:glucose N-acetyltransferase PWA37_000713 [Arxiozyma heterogenica]|uniref:Uncharacterized protein n=1 Tax=Arxiozyma heterogenica TaxID=278026 RepID=A0AAN8A9G3_9SACH|nr:hypothetical protein RI543_000599 [Kazachstania heterogenica]
MILLSKRKLRPILGIIIIFLVIYYFSRTVVQFQLNQQVEYYRNYFNKNRDNLQREFNPLEIKQIPGPVIDALYKKRQTDVISQKADPIDWDRYAYVNYVAERDYLCNTLIMFKMLKEDYKTKAKLVLLITTDVVSSVEGSSALLDKIKELDNDQVIVKFMEPISKEDDQTTWKNSLSKLEIFNLTEYERIIYLDNDANLNGNLDELFFLPDYVKFAATVTYWNLKESDLKKAYKEVFHMKNPININKYIERCVTRLQNGKMIYNHLPNLPHTLYLNSENIGDDILKTRTVFSLSRLFHTVKPSKVKWASDLMVIKPSNETYTYIRDVILPYNINTKGVYDMDVVNEYLYNMKQLIYDHFSVLKSIKHQYVPEVMVLPFSRYGLLSGSIKHKEQHDMLKNDMLGYRYLNSEGEYAANDLKTVVEEAKYIHYSDYPIGKPWQYATKDGLECKVKEHSKEKEHEQEMCNIWNSVVLPYFDKKIICS